MSEHKYWRHRWSPQHVTTVDMTGTINAPQWEPVHVLTDSELAARVTPTREQVRQVIVGGADWEYGFRNSDEIVEAMTDAILALMAGLAEGEGSESNHDY